MNPWKNSNNPFAIEQIMQENVYSAPFNKRPLLQDLTNSNKQGRYEDPFPIPSTSAYMTNAINSSFMPSMYPMPPAVSTTNALPTSSSESNNITYNAINSSSTQSIYPALQPAVAAHALHTNALANASLQANSIPAHSYDYNQQILTPAYNLVGNNHSQTNLKYPRISRAQNFKGIFKYF